MSGHWRLALQYVVWVIVLALPVVAGVSYLYGVEHAGSFSYGVGAGILCIISTALTVTLLQGRSQAAGLMIGGASFAGRYAFAAVALGVPAYLEAWPVVAMLIGFVGVYLTENVVLVPWVLGARSKPVAARACPEDERAKRRAEV